MVVMPTNKPHALKFKMLLIMIRS